MVAQLKLRGLDEDTLYVVVSDHGEYFGEHDLAEHSKDVYEPALRIPLVVARPHSTEGKVESEPVSIADVPRSSCWRAARRQAAPPHAVRVFPAAVASAAWSPSCTSRARRT